MSLLDSEIEKILQVLKEQPRLSENAEQEGQGLRDRQAEERIHNGAIVKEAGSEKIPVQASPEVESLLSRISSDCPYNDWFRVGCALKHEGCAYEVFRDWSAKAPKRFDEDACRRTWDSIGEDHDAKVSMGTLRWMANQTILPEPETLQEMAEQAAAFIDSMFLPGENFELVVNSWKNDKGKFLPIRRKETIFQHGETEQTSENL